MRKRSLGVGQLDVGPPQVFVAPATDVGASQIGAFAELGPGPAVLDPHPRAVDLHEPRLGVALREQLSLRRSRLRIGRLLHTQPARLVHQPQVGHRPLPRTTLGAIGFDERPIRFTLAIAPTIVRSQEHAAMLAAIPRTFFHYTPAAEKTPTHHHHIAIAKRLASKKSPRKSPTNRFCQIVGEVGLESDRNRRTFTTEKGPVAGVFDPGSGS